MKAGIKYFIHAAVVSFVVCIITGATASSSRAGFEKDIVISQVYGGGGLTGSPYASDYIELYNRGTHNISLDYMSIQYASAAGNFDQAIQLSGDIDPGCFYVIKCHTGTTGATIDNVRVTSDLDIDPESGKFALVDDDDPLNCDNATTCMPGQLMSIVDMVGWGSAGFYEGSAPAPAGSATTALLRTGCQDHDNNTADFAAATPTPSSNSNLVCRRLTISKSGTGTGMVTASPPGIICGDTCTIFVNDGGTVLLKAVTCCNSQFDGWSGGCSGTDNCTMTMTGDASVTATFSTLPVYEVGDAGGSCGEAQNAAFNSIIEGTLSNEDEDMYDYYRFVITEPTDVVLYETGPDHGNFGGRLYNSSCVNIGGTNDNLPKTATLNPGTYYAAITTHGSGLLTYNLHIAPAGKITGRVTDEGGQGIVNLYVYAGLMHGGYSSSARTIDNGTYTITGLPAELYVVDFIPNYSPATGQNYFEESYNDKLDHYQADLVWVVEGQTVSGIDAQLRTAGKITGRVTNAQGQPIAGITVELYPEGETSRSRHSETDDNGTYSFVVLTTGSYNVRFVPGYEQNYLGEWYSGRDNQTAADSIAVTAGQTTAGINAQLRKGGSITGRVTGAGGLVPLEGAWVWIEGSKTAITAADGTYTVVGLPTSDYSVVFSLQVDESNCDMFEEDYPGYVSVIAGQVTSGINVDLGNVPAIAGRVTDAEGAGIGGIHITASGVTAGDYETYSSNTGYYGILLPEGEYTVYFNGNGIFRNEWYNNKFQVMLAQTVSVGCEQPVTGINAQLSVIAGGVSGRIAGPDNESLAGVPVRVYDLSDNLAGTAVTNSLGGYIIGLQEGTYKLYVPGFVDDSTCYAGQWYSGKAAFETADPVSVNFGHITGDIDLQVASSLCAAIQGTVTADGGSVPAGLEVKIFDLSNNLVTTGTTNSSGSYEINVTPGSYKVYFAPWDVYGGQWYSAQTSFAAADTVSVAAGETADGIDADLQYANPCGDIQGRVTSGGFGVPNAGVRAYDENENEVATAEGDPYGNYILSCIPSGNYKIYFERGDIFVPEYYNNATSFEQADLVPVNDGETTGNINADLSTPFGAVQGRVLDYYGNGLPDTNVFAYDQDGDFALYGRTDLDGNYAIVGLTEGNYRIYFEPVDGLHIGEYFDNKENLAGADPVSVHDGQTTPNIDAQLSLGGAISGCVVNPDGDPLSGNIYIIDVATHVHRLCRTGDNGTYVAAGLIPGKYRVKFEADGELYAPEYYNDKASYELADNITIAIADNITGINAQLAVGGAIHGRVTAGGDGASDARVSVYNQDGFIKDTLTQSEGYFTLSGLASGQYKVKFDCYDVYFKQWHNNRASFETADEIAVTVGLTAEIGTVSLAEGLCGGFIQGTVTDEQGTPLQSISVLVYDEWGSEVAYVQTDTDGAYSTDSIEGGVIEEGQYKVQFVDSSNEFLYEFYNDFPDINSAGYVSVYDGQATSNINAQLARPGKISGTVKGPDNQTLSGISVGAYNPGNENIVSSAATETDGRYTISGLRSGNYKVRFSDVSGSYVPQWYDGNENFAAADNVSATSGLETGGINARLSAYGRITGRVTYAGGGDGIPDVRVYIYDSDMNPVQAGTVFMTDSQGAYSIGKLATGMYKVYFSDPVGKWYNNRTSSGEADLVSVTMGSTTSGIDAQFAASGISGRVTNSLGHSVAGATVWAFTETENYTATTNDDGRYTVLVPPDAYRVAFGNLNTWYDSKDSYDNADTVVVQAEQITANIDGQVPDGKISGRVSFYCGEGDSIEGPVAEALVTVFDSSGKALESDNSDVNGEYHITLPMGETYKVLFVYPHNFVISSSECPASYSCSSWDYYEWYEKRLSFGNATDVTVSNFGSRNIDSYFRAGVDNCSRISTTTTSIRYASQNNTVTDHDTGLEWFQNANYLGGVRTWEDAVEEVKALNDNGSSGTYGHNDWRLPTRDEFATIIDTGHSNPALLPGLPFINVQPDRYWTSTTRAPLSSEWAYWVNLATGVFDYMGGKDSGFYVWPVRSLASSMFKTLTVTKTGRGTGQVQSQQLSSVNVEVVCDPVCYTTFTEGPSIILKADPDDSMTFAGRSAWTGCDSFTTDNACIVDMDEPREIEVRFDNPYNITVNPKAIIVAGSGPYVGNNLWDTTQALTIYAYNELLAQGFTGESIYYMTFDPTVDADSDGEVDYDNESSLLHLEHAVKGWAADADSLVIYLMGHGIDGQFEINGIDEEFLSGDDLGLWLDTLQGATGMPVIVVYEACYSGSFLPMLMPGSGAGGAARLVVTGADADERAWFADNGLVSFSRYFWMGVETGKTVDQCFVKGRDGMELPGYQHALLDADSDGYDTGGADMGAASRYKIGRGLVPAAVDVVIGTAMPDKLLYGDNHTADIWVSNISPSGTVALVWAVIRRPGVGSGIGSRAVTDLPTVVLPAAGGGQYRDAYDNFTTPGVYTVAAYALDISGMGSLPKVTRVIKDTDSYEDDDVPGQAKPIIVNSGYTQFHNFWEPGDVDWVKFYGMPLDTGSQPYTISLSGRGARCDATVELYGPDNATKLAADTFDEVSGSMTWGCAEEGMYYLKIYPADQASYEEQTYYGLKVYNPSAPVLGLIKGSITSGSGGGPISSAVITTDGGFSAISSSGAYEMPHEGGGPYALTANASGYQTYTHSGINLESRQTLVLNIVMTPIGGTSTTTTASAVSSTTTTATAATSTTTTSVRPKCPTRKAMGEGHEAELEALRKFRDARLSPTADGAQLVALYYRHSDELSMIFEKRSDIEAEVRELILELLPQAMAEPNLKLSNNMKQRIFILIDQIRAEASPGLKKTLRLVRKKIEKGEVPGGQ